MLRILTQNNLDCIFEMCTTDPKDESMKSRYLKLISVSRIDNLYTDTYVLDSPHFYQEPYTLEPRDVSERLIRMNQRYKNSLQHAINMKRKDFSVLE